MPTPEIQLTPHAETILEQYRALEPFLGKMADALTDKLHRYFEEAGLVPAALEHRVKTEASLVGKLELKGDKYRDIYDITDLIGLRVITFYADDVDRVASVMEHHFGIDWENSVDKRKAHETDSFGYLSLHYICRVPKRLYYRRGHPELNNLRFEVQMRTVLQHAWANMNHDTGYKSGVEVPRIYLRQLSRLAGILELVDDEFGRLRTEITDYRRRMQSLVASGRLDEVALDGDTFRSYLEVGPFDELNHRIAAVNQAEILPVSLMHFLPLLQRLDFRTLEDVDAMIRDCSEGAYQLARYQIGLSDIDIISSSIGLQNLCLVHTLKKGGGVPGVRFVLDQLNGPSDSNLPMAEYLVSQARGLPFMNQ
ncbi:MAG: hypothetical protein IJ578_04950 [Bacteroidales bacterium]|nr:hypothetical protein [Bacteroidales bacterium]